MCRPHTSHRKRLTDLNHMPVFSNRFPQSGQVKPTKVLFNASESGMAAFNVDV